ncbi:MAG: carboxylesterase/lipase family protein [Myxococcales bacterium]|nr:carboxylesterase/lipase family protein [Myxococcales bacterium]
MTSAVVETSSGKLRGLLKDGVRVWRGIPYAAVPERFRAPVSTDPWRGERDATQWGPVAIQSRDPRIAMMSGVGEKMPMAEDCLTANVFAPEGADRAPVLVWIHGGAFVMGSGSTPLYDGRTFASRHGLVVVTFNYRLGLLGFLGGNWALLDQVALLEWVRDNIAAFGGDPANVTIVGESAGASSVAALLVMPRARGLFVRAVLQSCAIGAMVPTRDDNAAMAAELGLAAEASIEAILAAQAGLAAKRGLAAFAPFVDGDVVPEGPIAAVRAGRAAQVPLLLGWNRDEWKLFDVFLGPGSSEAVKEPMRNRLGDAKLDEILKAYDGDWIAICGDLAFRMPSTRIAEGHRAPAWLYRFDWTSPAMGGALGAAHGLDLPFMWNKLELKPSQLLIGGDTVGAQPLATAMHDTWAAFVKTGEPAGDGLPAWPSYDAQKRATMLLDRESRVVDDPDRQRRVTWDGVI